MAQFSRIVCKIVGDGDVIDENLIFGEPSCLSIISFMFLSTKGNNDISSLEIHTSTSSLYKHYFVIETFQLLCWSHIKLINWMLINLIQINKIK